MTEPLLAIFVGGASSRMGTDKGLLPAPGGGPTILEALVERGAEAGLPTVFVGRAEPYDAIAPKVPRIPDLPAGAGPLAGLNAALRTAREQQSARVIAVACDMPYVTAHVLRALAEHPSSAAVLSPRRGAEAPWEPMLARYDVKAIGDVLDAAIARGLRSFQGLFASLEVDALPVTDEVARALRDWDAPGDIPQ